MSNSKSAFQSFTSSYSSSSVNGQTSSKSESTYTDPSGTKIYRTTQEAGQERREEREEYDTQGKRLEAGKDSGRIEDVTANQDEEQRKKDLEYEERMEEEYAKREGGA